MQTETGNMRWKSWRQNSTLIFSAKSSTTVVFKNSNWQRLVGSHFFPNKLRDIGVNWKHPAGPLFLVMVCQHVTPSQKSSLTFSERGTLCMWEWELCVNVRVCVRVWVSVRVCAKMWKKPRSFVCKPHFHVSMMAKKKRRWKNATLWPKFVVWSIVVALL